MLKWDHPASLIPDLNLAQKRAISKYAIKTVGDLLSLIPRRYDDYSHCTPIGKIPIGQPVTVKGEVVEIKKAPGFRRKITMIRAKVKDASGTLSIIWFNQPWILDQLSAGKEIFVSGNVTFRPRFGRQMANPIWEPADDPAITGRIAPVYPLTGSVAQKTMRELLAHLIELDVEAPDYLPTEIRDRYRLPSMREAFGMMHRPENMEQAERGRKRVAFNECFYYGLALGATRKEADVIGAPKIAFDENFAKAFVKALPFELTDDQKRSAWSAIGDMEKTRPMRRLLQGDVGSGKTVVAALLMAMAYRSHQSAVFMAPTELLAKQHAVSLRRFLEAGDPCAIMLITSSDRRIWEGGEEKKMNLLEARERMQEGRVIVIGTHALLYRDMLPPDTALAIVDEQHRFGVAQREALSVARRPDGLVPHLLSMTATPIPRSLALTMYGDLDISIIRTKPKGRMEIKTKVLTASNQDEAYEAIRSEAKKGNRAFVVCPLIDESDTLGFKSVTEEAKRLASGPLKGLRIGVLHGKMKPVDKDGVMGEFAEGLLDVLVSTTVVEVGVDIPEATLMIIDGAERFGLAQLHQLRGRVGRSPRPSFCFLLTSADGAGFDRLRVLERTNDGFIVAEEDLKRRGTGNLLGTQQSGSEIFRVAQVTDLDVMAEAKEASEEIIAQDPDLSAHPDLRKIVDHLRETSHQE